MTSSHLSVHREELDFYCLSLALSLAVSLSLYLGLGVYETIACLCLCVSVCLRRVGTHTPGRWAVIVVTAATL